MENALGGTRTHNLGLRSALLYPVELPGRDTCCLHAVALVGVSRLAYCPSTAFSAVRSLHHLNAAWKFG